MCQGRWFWWRKHGRFGRNQKMHRVGIGRWSPSDGPEEYASKMLIYPLWCSADGELPMKSRKERRIRTLRKSWCFGCNILSCLFFRLIFSLGSSNVCRNRLGLDSARLYISVVRDWKKLDTHPIQYNFTIPLHFFGDFAFSLLFSTSSFKLIKDASHSSDLICWWELIEKKRKEAKSPKNTKEL